MLFKLTEVACAPWSPRSKPSNNLTNHPHRGGDARRAERVLLCAHCGRKTKSCLCSLFIEASLTLQMEYIWWRWFFSLSTMNSFTHADEFFRSRPTILEIAARYSHTTLRYNRTTAWYDCTTAWFTLFMQINQTIHGDKWKNCPPLAGKFMVVFCRESLQSLPLICCDYVNSCAYRPAMPE